MTLLLQRLNGLAFRVTSESSCRSMFELAEAPSTSFIIAMSYGLGGQSYMALDVCFTGAGNRLQSIIWKRITMSTAHAPARGIDMSLAPAFLQLSEVFTTLCSARSKLHLGLG